ncbi:MAG: MmcQ/YjbR family DNA-binding protein [Pseudomonadales bacterium]
MDYADIRGRLLSRPEAQEDFPFAPDIAVMKIKGKMFATLSTGKTLDGQASCPHINLKCDPEQALMLRDIFPAVIPGYHMNKRHWNTLVLDGSIPAGEVQRMLEHSYSLVVKGLTKVQRTALELSYSAQELHPQHH